MVEKKVWKFKGKNVAINESFKSYILLDKIFGEKKIIQWTLTYKFFLSNILWIIKFI